MNKRLLILGTLGEFEQLVQKARARGIYTIVCDGYPDGPARAFADESYVIPVTDTDRIAALCKEKQVDGILTSFSDLLLECMVKISAKAGLPCYLTRNSFPGIVTNPPPGDCSKNSVFPPLVLQKSPLPD